jgi:hypothetical protein
VQAAPLTLPLTAARRMSDEQIRWLTIFRDRRTENVILVGEMRDLETKKSRSGSG